MRRLWKVADGTATDWLIGPLVTPPNTFSSKDFKKRSIFRIIKVSFWSRNKLQLKPVKEDSKPSPKYHRPATLESEDWNDILETVWNTTVAHTEDYGALTRALQTKVDGNQQQIQLEWDLFMSCLNVGFRRALLKIQQNIDQTDLKKEVDAVLTKPGASVKGRKGQFQWCSVSTRAKGDPGGSEFLRRLRRKLARAYELKRLCGTQKEIDPNLL